MPISCAGSPRLTYVLHHTCLGVLQVEREARYMEYVERQPFRSLDVLDAQFLRRIVTRAGSAAAARFPVLVKGAS
jgi:hypothetical protein